MDRRDEKEREKVFLSNLIYDCRLSGCSTKQIKEIVCTFKPVSLRYIQRILKNKKLSTRKQRDSLESVEAAINNELQGPGSLLGYRSMWRRLTTKYSLSVSRDTVMMLLATIDTDGTKQRKSRRLSRRMYLNKGPNYLWHLDGYDKLKPYGITIHGCIDGYSRKILWLKACCSNNNPHIIAKYYLDCVRYLNGCPRILRTDMGTENSLLALIQPVLRHYHNDDLSGSKSFLYGKSINNQRIEALWCQMRRQHTHWWISFFKTLVIDGHLRVNLPYHLDIVRYCFGTLIQFELDQFRYEWNSHHIRPSKHADAPSGKPDVMYHFPSLYGTRNHAMSVDTTELDIIEEEYNCIEGSLVSNEFTTLVDAIKSTYQVQSHQPLRFQTALYLFFLLIEIFE